MPKIGTNYSAAVLLSLYILHITSTYDCGNHQIIIIKSNVMGGKKRVGNLVEVLRQQSHDAISINPNHIMK